MVRKGSWTRFLRNQNQGQAEAPLDPGSGELQTQPPGDESEKRKRGRERREVHPRRCRMVLALVFHRGRATWGLGGQTGQSGGLSAAPPELEPEGEEASAGPSSLLPVTVRCIPGNAGSLCSRMCRWSPTASCADTRSLLQGASRVQGWLRVRT